MPASAPPARILSDFLDVYAVAEVELLRSLAASVKKGVASDDQVKAAMEATRLRSRTDSIVRKLLKAIATAGLSMLFDAVTHGGREAMEDLAALFGGKGSDYEAPINRGALDNLARSLSDTVTPAHLSITRVIDDAYRSIIGRAAVGTLTGTQTRWQSSQAALNEFAAQGITGFTDKRGRNWELSSYAEMAARSVTARAAVDAHTDRLAAAGIELVYVSDSPQECPLCRQWEGKVLSIAGDGGARTITTENALTNEPVQLDIAGSVNFARAAGLLHPNCTHSLSAYLHGATKLPEATENPQGYEDRQQLRYLERGVRKAKRVQAAALGPEAKKKADVRVRAWESRIRQHVKDTGIMRQRKREQIMVGRADQAGDLRPQKVEAPKRVEQATIVRDAPATPELTTAPEPRALTAAQPDTGTDLDSRAAAFERDLQGLLDQEARLVEPGAQDLASAPPHVPHLVARNLRKPERAQEFRTAVRGMLEQQYPGLSDREVEHASLDAMTHMTRMMFPGDDPADPPVGRNIRRTLAALDRQAAFRADDRDLATYVQAAREQAGGRDDWAGRNPLAADGGPSEVAAERLEAIRTAGAAVAAEVARKMESLPPGFEAAARRRTLAEVRGMGAADDAEIPLNWGKGTAAKRELLSDMFDRAQSSYPTEWLATNREKKPDGLTVITERRRAYYDPNAHTMDTGVYDDPAHQEALIIHEVGHSFERVMPHLKAVQWAFLRDRIANGEPGSRTLDPRTLIYADADEAGYKDDFRHHYTGKTTDWEGPASHFEILTTGVESLLAKGRKDYTDADMEHFILGVLAVM